MIDPESVTLIQMLRRFAAVMLFGMLGVVLLTFTTVDVLICFLARKRRRGLGARPVSGALWQLLLSPTRHAFWAIGFWIALATLLVILYRLFAGSALAAY